MALILKQPLFWILLGVAALLLAAVAWRRRLHWRPAWAFRLVLVLLALIAAFFPQGKPGEATVTQPQILVVDQSDSLDIGARQLIQQQAQSWQADGNHRSVISVGDHAEPVLSPDQTWPAVDGRASNLAEGLEMARSLLGGLPGRVVLATDGSIPQTGDVQAAVAEIHAAGSRLDVIPLLSRSSPADGFVGSLSAPANLWEGTPFDVLAPIFPPQNQTSQTLELKINGVGGAVEAEPLGQNYYRLHIPAQKQGIVTLELTAAFDGDPFPANNSTFATLQVFPSPRVLFLSSSSANGSVSAFVEMLRLSGLQVDVLDPSNLPTDLNVLKSYKVIFMHDVLASLLSQEQMTALQVFVSRLSGGLIFLGGRSSYTLGGYQNTALQPMLPVKLEPPPRAKRPPVVFMLVLDQSGSMGITRFGEVRPIDLAREAAMRSIETMQSEDYLGVLTFSDQLNWAVPLRPLGDGLSLREALDAVSRVDSTGGTHMYSAIQDALGAMAALPDGAPPNRHMLILSDGRSFDGSPEEFQALAQAAHDMKITVSTIAFGPEADAELLTAIAKTGKGRYYPVTDAADLPRVMVLESQAARSENIQAGQTDIKLSESDHPVLFGLSPSQLPVLTGYNALSTRTKDGAEDILVSGSFGDPILSSWQYGLGRVLVWTGDIGEEWASPWPDGGSESAFWSQVVRYALVSPSLGPAQVNVQVEDTRLAVEAVIQNNRGEPVNLADVSFSFVAADGQVRRFQVPQSAPGEYRLELDRPAEGAYRAVLAYPAEDGARAEAAASFAVNPPLEWIPILANQAAANLNTWAGEGGGQLLTAESFFAPAVVEESTSTISPGRDRLIWILLALLLLWPVEIAVRRRWLPWT